MDNVHYLTKVNKELDEKYNSLLKDFNVLKEKTDYLHNFKQDVDKKIEKMLVELDARENSFKDNEQNLLNRVNTLTNENNELEEKVQILLKKEGVSSKEVEQLTKKVRDFDLVLEENSKE